MTELSLRTPEPAPRADAVPARRRPFTDNPRLIGIAVVIVLGLMVALFFMATRTEQLRPEFISEVVIYALLGVCLVLLLPLVFVLARNLFKLWVERRRGLPFARFRAKLVVAMLLMTIVPSVLVLIIGSEIISSSAERWFSTPADELVQTAQAMAQTIYAERAGIVRARSERLASSLPPAAIASADLTALQPRLTAELASTSSGLIEVYRVVSPAPGAPRDAVFVTAVGASSMSANRSQASADRLAAKVAASGRAEETQDLVSDGVSDGLLIRAATPVRSAGLVVGVIVASEAVKGQLYADARRVVDINTQYQQIKVLKRPLQGFYLTFFLMATLLILVSATWFGLFIAKRITRPVQMLAEGARAVGAGQLDLRIEPDSTDELGSLVESFNTMAAELRTSHERLDARRRYIETILERVATGVVSLSVDGKVQTINRAAAAILSLDATAIGRKASEVFARPDLAALVPIVTGPAPGRVEEITLVTDERELHLAVATTVLASEGGAAEGAVVVLDDVTPLIRAERVAAWRDVARRLAHEIKNPLTPIQLSAERLQRNFATAPPNARALVEECTAAIITEVEALKGLVDEFAQFARMRGPKLAAADLNLLAADTLRLYVGVLQQGAITFSQHLTPGIPRVRMDSEQMRQVLINLVDNAIDALGGARVGVRADGTAPSVAVATSFDAATGLVRLTISDNGPGVPAADRDKLFLPYYSTKGRGSGLGLAIVRRIITEHGGTVTVGDAHPRGAEFMIELPAA